MASWIVDRTETRPAATTSASMTVLLCELEIFMTSPSAPFSNALPVAVRNILGVRRTMVTRLRFATKIGLCTADVWIGYPDLIPRLGVRPMRSNSDKIMLDCKRDARTFIHLMSWLFITSPARRRRFSTGTSRVRNNRPLTRISLLAPLLVGMAMAPENRCERLS